MVMESPHSRGSPFSEIHARKKGRLQSSLGTHLPEILRKLPEAGLELILGLIESESGLWKP